MNEIYANNEFVDQLCLDVCLGKEGAAELFESITGKNPSDVKAGSKKVCVRCFSSDHLHILEKESDDKLKVYKCNKCGHKQATDITDVTSGTWTVLEEDAWTKKG